MILCFLVNHHIHHNPDLFVDLILDLKSRKLLYYALKERFLK